MIEKSKPAAELSTASSEWLVTDQRGAFAMGTPQGFRTRKYHSFYSGVAGRSELNFLTDIELHWGEQALWPHIYSGNGTGGAAPVPIIHPAVSADFMQQPHPTWTWRLPEGILTLRVQARSPGGIALVFEFEMKPGGKPKPKSKVKAKSRSKAKVSSASALRAQLPLLRLRPFFALRDLHATGGQLWTLHRTSAGSAGGVVKITAGSGNEVHLGMKGPWHWQEEPLWYRNFFYPEESLRGYQDREDLHSAGEFKLDFNASRSSELTELGFLVSEDPADVTHYISSPEPEGKSPPSFAAQDFILTRPAGIVAGYPWFGEWGRDTFVSLPGLVAAWLGAGGSETEVWDWAHEVLGRWGEWIQKVGMLPNLIEKEGSHQWESSDATLWWCHSLAALWQLTLADREKARSRTSSRKITPGLDPSLEFQKRYVSLLNLAIDSIQAGRHPFLKLNADALLEVTEAHTTWMDARFEGAPVTPRTGVLPEINALWFQARCLQALWADEKSPYDSTENWQELERLGRAVLNSTHEEERPNRIFLHSIPLAPSLALQDEESLLRDFTRIYETLWTPVGLRTLEPKDSRYRPECCGSQEERDMAYHQGPAWGWLGGHFEMARARLGKRGELQGRKTLARKMFDDKALERMPIRGHIAELFDAEAPFKPRGAPAQAWSLACLEEAKARKKFGLVNKLTALLAQRWLGRRERKSIRGASASSPEAGSSEPGKFKKKMKKKTLKISGAVGL